MISKKKEDFLFMQGAGRPFEMNKRDPIAKNDLERQVPLIINLSDLNGQTFSKGMPKNYHRKPGRTLPTFTKYWTKDEDSEDDFDVE